MNEAQVQRAADWHDLQVNEALEARATMLTDTAARYQGLAAEDKVRLAAGFYEHFPLLTRWHGLLVP